MKKLTPEQREKILEVYGWWHAKPEHPAMVRRWERDGIGLYEDWLDQQQAEPTENQIAQRKIDEYLLEGYGMVVNGRGMIDVEHYENWLDQQQAEPDVVWEDSERGTGWLPREQAEPRLLVVCPRCACHFGVEQQAE